MKIKRFVAAAFCVAVVSGSASMALAGEVKGPPGTINNVNETGALDHARSDCAASGLNDFDTTDPDGQMVSQVQTPADSWRYYGLPKGFVGVACRGRGNAG